jgi:hypothetical protein
MPIIQSSPVYASRSALAEVAVVFVDPVLAGWGEDVEVDAVGECGGGVREVAGDDEDLAFMHGLRGAVVEVEAEGTLGDEGDLLVVVGVAGDDAASGEDYAGEHGFFAGYEFAGEKGIELLVFDGVPVIESGFGHGASAFLGGDDMGEMNFLLCVVGSLV